MPGMTPAIVFFALDPDVTRQFYETLGLTFVEEKHGEGPVHYACDFRGAVLEIYPLRAGVSIKPCDVVGAAFPVAEFDKTVAALKAMDLKPGKVVIYLEERRLRAVSVRDPDGRLIRLLESGEDPPTVH